MSERALSGGRRFRRAGGAGKGEPLPDQRPRPGGRPRTTASHSAPAPAGATRQCTPAGWRGRSVMITPRPVPRAAPTHPVTRDGKPSCQPRQDRSTSSGQADARSPRQSRHGHRRTRIVPTQMSSAMRRSSRSPTWPACHPSGCTTCGTARPSSRRLGRIASDASFGSSRERLPPAVQRATLSRARSDSRPQTVRDVGRQQPVGSGVTTLRLTSLR